MAETDGREITVCAHLEGATTATWPVMPCLVCATCQPPSRASLHLYIDWKSAQLTLTSCHKWTNIKINLCRWETQCQYQRSWDWALRLIVTNRQLSQVRGTAIDLVVCSASLPAVTNSAQKTDVGVWVKNLLIMFGRKWKGLLVTTLVHTVLLRFKVLAASSNNVGSKATVHISLTYSCR